MIRKYGAANVVILNTTPGITAPRACKVSITTPSELPPGQRRHVVRADGGYWAFVPPPLPPDMPLDLALVRQLSAADRALGLLAGAARTLPNPRLLARALLRREAVRSSRIEGTQASLSELVLFEADGGRGATEDVQEVFNYLAAVEHVLDPTRRLPMSLSLLREAPPPEIA